LSRSRVVVENTFGILVTKFRIFKKPIPFNPEKVSVITMTCILLHNYLRKSTTSSQIYMPPGNIDTYDENGMLITPGTWRKERKEFEATCAVRNIPITARRSALNAREIRDEFTKYFVSR
jgi:hypothetical protein